VNRRILIVSGVLGLAIAASFLPDVRTDDNALGAFLLFTICSLVQFWRAWRAR
jgi:hypothetical protein